MSYPSFRSLSTPFLNKSLFSPLLWGVLLFAMHDDTLAQNSPVIRQKIEANWQFRQAGKDTWKPATVPGSVHTALLNNQMIEDPFYRDNEEKLQWIEKEDWEYEGVFNADEALLQKKHIEITFRGLDTYAHVFLNDSLVLETDNMFRTWTADVKKWLKPGANKLHIYFESPIKKVETEWKNLGYELPGGIRTMTRKAQFHYGWDWGPRFVGCGLLQTPEFVAWDDFIVDNIFITPLSIDTAKAKMVIRFRYRSDVSGKVNVMSRYEKRKSVEERTLQKGVAVEDSMTFEIENPRLWWCAGMGEPALYDVSFEVKMNYRTLEKIDTRTGVRKVELVTEKDDKGETFYFKLNGKPVFAKGANYIPLDIFQDRVPASKYKEIVDNALAANMNMLRVWGGGIYEDDLFYQYCDSRGIMVWQDFMYACALYPGNGGFLKTAAREALEQVERLRKHPCIALWCGNNENNEAWHNWGWQMQFTEAQRKQLWGDYQTLFNDLLKVYVERNAGGVAYWESSPRYGRANPKSHTEGDSHYWGVWHDEEPFSVLDKKVPRFMSEFGFQSFPEWRTIQSFTLPEDRQLESKVMLLHQKHPRGNALIAEYMKRDYLSPKKFEDFVYVSQLLQAEGMRTGLEAHRRNKPYCMGTLYWQLNDVWPVASWSSIDYLGRWKALHYYAREAFSPLAALPFLENETLKIYGVNDLADVQRVNLRVRALNFEGKNLSDITLKEVELRTDSSHFIWQGSLRSILNGQKPDNAVVEISLADASGKTLYRRLYYAVPPKKLALPKAKVSLEVVQNNDGYDLSLQSDRLAKNVLIRTEVNGFFSDNYFDLLPGERKTVHFKTQQILDAPQAAFSVRHLEETIE